MLDSHQSYSIGKQVIQLILNSSDSLTLLTKIANTVGDLLEVDTCAIVYGDTNSNDVELGLWQKQKTSLLPNTELKQLVKVWEEQYQQKLEPVAFVEGLPTESIANKVLTVLSLKSSLAIATNFRGKVNGLVLVGTTQSHQWTDSERELLKSVSDSMAIAISQIHLEKQAQTKSRYHTLLNQLSRAIGKSSDLDSILNLALEETAKALQIDRGKILMLKYKDPLFAQKRTQLPQATLQVACHWQAMAQDSNNIEHSSFKLSDSWFCQQAWQKAPQPLAIAEQAANTDLQDINIQNYQALLMMPLMGNSTHDRTQLVLGFLVLQQERVRLWQPDELELVNWVAIQISTAIIHHQTLNQVQSLVDDRTAQLKLSLDVQAKLSAKMRRQIEQLKQLNELKDDFLSSMGHELRTPLTSMKMAIQMLRQSGLPDEMRSKYLDILEQEWYREYNLIKDLLTLQKVESAEFTVHPQQLELKETIARLKDSFEQKWQLEKGLSLETKLPDEPLRLYTDPESLEQILKELLLNAGKYSDPDTTVTIEVHQQTLAKGREIEATVTNRGAGITPDEVPYIFDKFRRGKGVTDRAVPGTGLGLALVKCWLEHLNGQIEVTSEPTDNADAFVTSFRVKIPQYQSS